MPRGDDEVKNILRTRKPFRDKRDVLIYRRKKESIFLDTFDWTKWQIYGALLSFFLTNGRALGGNTKIRLTVGGGVDDEDDDGDDSDEDQQPKKGKKPKVAPGGGPKGPNGEECKQQ